MPITVLELIKILLLCAVFLVSESFIKETMGIVLGKEKVKEREKNVLESGFMQYIRKKTCMLNTIILSSIMFVGVGLFFANICTGESCYEVARVITGVGMVSILLEMFLIDFLNGLFTRYIYDSFLDSIATVLFNFVVAICIFYIRFSQDIYAKLVKKFPFNSKQL